MHFSGSNIAVDVGLVLTFRKLYFFTYTFSFSFTCIHILSSLFLSKTKQNETKWNEKKTFHKCIWLMDEHACAYFERLTSNITTRSTNWSKNRIIIGCICVVCLDVRTLPTFSMWITKNVQCLRAHIATNALPIIITITVVRILPCWFWKPQQCQIKSSLIVIFLFNAHLYCPK